MKTSIAMLCAALFSLWRWFAERRKPKGKGIADRVREGGGTTPSQ